MEELNRRTFFSIQIMGEGTYISATCCSNLLTVFFSIKYLFLVSKKDFRDYGCIVIAILSHGSNEERIWAYDDHFNLTDTLVNPIAKNSSLENKPKIFIISACKGSDEKTIVQNSEPLVADAVPFTSSNRVPYVRDILKCYSTYEGKSKRSILLY